MSTTPLDERVKARERAAFELWIRPWGLPELGAAWDMWSDIVTEIQAATRWARWQGERPSPEHKRTALHLLSLEVGEAYARSMLQVCITQLVEGVNQAEEMHEHWRDFWGSQQADKVRANWCEDMARYLETHRAARLHAERQAEAYREVEVATGERWSPSMPTGDSEVELTPDNPLHVDYVEPSPPPSPSPSPGGTFRAALDEYSAHAAQHAAPEDTIFDGFRAGEHQRPQCTCDGTRTPTQHDVFCPWREAYLREQHASGTTPPGETPEQARDNPMAYAGSFRPREPAPLRVELTPSTVHGVVPPRGHASEDGPRVHWPRGLKPAALSVAFDPKTNELTLRNHGDRPAVVHGAVYGVKREDGTLEVRGRSIHGVELEPVESPSLRPEGSTKPDDGSERD